MKKLFLALALLVVPFVIFPQRVVAQNEIKESMAGGPHFRAGDTVVLEETLEGDAYIAGGNVIINGGVVGDLLVAGGNVEINGEVTDDIRVAGGSVRINGHVGKNISIFGGTLSLSSNSVVGGSVIAAGGTVSLDGQVAGNTVAAGGTVSLTGEFAGNVKAEADSVLVSKEAEVAGDLIANYESSADVSEAASIGQLQVNKQERKLKPERDEALQVVGKFLIWAKLLAMFMAVLMGFVGGSVFMYLFPTTFDKLVKSATTNPIGNLGWGFIQLIMMPVLAIMLMITVLGLPLAGAVWLFYLLSLLFACWLAALIVGRSIFKFSKLALFKNNYMQLFVGLIILQIVTLIPIVGWLLRFVIFIAALGSLLVFTKDQFRKGATKKRAKK